MLDMAGNGWRRKLDWHYGSYYVYARHANMNGPPSGNQSELRSGYWDSGGDRPPATPSRLAATPSAWSLGALPTPQSEEVSARDIFHVEATKAHLSKPATRVPSGKLRSGEG